MKIYYFDNDTYFLLKKFRLEIKRIKRKNVITQINQFREYFRLFQFEVFKNTLFNFYTFFSMDVFMWQFFKNCLVDFKIYFYRLLNMKHIAVPIRSDLTSRIVANYD